MSIMDFFRKKDGYMKQGNGLTLYGPVVNGIRLKRTMDNEGKPYYYYEKDGKLKGPFEFAQDFSCGYGVLQQFNEPVYRFMDKKGNISSEAYVSAHSYVEGFAVVVNEDGDYYFRDTKGQLIGPYKYAGDYGKGFGGFAAVIELKDNNDQWAYRDLIGRISKLPTASGKCFYDFVKGKINYDEIPGQFFIDERFYNAVLSRIMMELKKHVNREYRNNGNIPSQEEVASIIEELGSELYTIRQNAIVEKQEAEDRKKFMPLVVDSVNDKQNEQDKETISKRTAQVDEALESLLI